MLLRFTVGNFKSFKEKATLSLEATSDDWLEEGNVAVVGERRLLKAAAIYGANASGKSNLLTAMAFFRDWVENSSKETQSGERIPVAAPFLLHVDTETAPTFFEAVFLHEGTRYRYGFETTQERIVSEWLFCQRDSIRETRLFTREGGCISPSDDFREGKGLEKRTRSNALFLSVAAQFNGPVSNEIMHWMARFRNISGLEDGRDRDMAFTANKLGDEEYSAVILELARKADLGIEGMQKQDLSADEALAMLPQGAVESVRPALLKGETLAFYIKTYHRKYGTGKDPVGQVAFSLKVQESAGTRTFVALTGPVLHTLKRGFTLFVDELEARLHPLLTRALVGLFNSSANTQNAQLVFATHDNGLLDAKRVRRDQVWFVEKDDYGASRLYSLAEFKVRKEAKFSKEYLLGQFGAAPRVGDMEEVLEQALGHGDT